MTITATQARERFGMTLQDAHRTRDTALQSLAPAEVTAARKAWADMADLVRASQHHPELTRFKFLDALANGCSVLHATTVARNFAAS